VRVDVHQHIWTPALVDRLAERESLPLVRREHGVTVLHSAGELPYVIDIKSEAPARRAACLREDGLDLALVAISSPIGIEALPRESALELIDAHLEGALALPPEFAAWGPVALDGAEPADVDSLLQRGCVGVSMASGAIAGPDRLYAIGHMLERIAARGVPLFVHPGLAPGQRAGSADLDEPIWWRPLTAYVSQMQAAWLTFAGLGRREFPDLRVVFSMLAGGAPLLTERLSARGGPTIELDDPNSFYETSSYGPAAVEMMARRVGELQLVYGSDRPVIDPQTTGRDRALQINASDLLKVVNYEPDVRGLGSVRPAARSRHGSLAPTDQSRSESAHLRAAL
jgi:6-methylsalicylate decarboxylase